MGFGDIPVQMCHFHQEQIIIRYTTQKPELPVGQELLALVKTLAHVNKTTFTRMFEDWCNRWKDFLNEKSIDERGQRRFTHRRLRSARSSLCHHLPYLFTFEDNPSLNIPNTTNSLDGSFKKVKTAVSVHAGLTHERKIKLVTSLIMKKKHHI